MPEFAFTIGALAVASLGLSAGALLAEACVLVPFWRSEPPEQFLSWYRRHAGLLLRFFGSLEAASGLFVAAASLFAWLGFLPGRWTFSGAALLTLAVLASFPLYFKAANASFAAGTIAAAALGAELARWAAWHGARSGFAVAAFLLALLALACPGPSSAP